MKLQSSMLNILIDWYSMRAENRGEWDFRVCLFPLIERVTLVVEAGFELE